MEIEIRGHNLPGRWFRNAGVPIHNVHVGLQVRGYPDALVPGDAESATWRADVRVDSGDDGCDFRGPAVHGTRGERFLYLTWGDVAGDGRFNMFRRAKLMFGAVDSALIDRANTGDRPLVATIDLTDGHGCPRCARVDATALVWSLG